MSYDPVAHMNKIKAKGHASYSDWYHMIRGHEDNAREIERERERERANEEYKRRNLYDMYENDDQERAKTQQQKNDLMATSSFKAASIMPRVKSLVADKQYVTTGIAGRAVIGNDIFHAKGGRRRTRHKRSGGKKRSGHKRSGHKRNKRSGHKRSGGHMSRRR